MPERYYTLTEAARHTRGVDGQPLQQVSLRAAVERGYLKAEKRGRKWYVSESALRAYLRERPKWRRPRRST